MKKTKHRLILLVLALWCTALAAEAQNAYFSVVAGLPHLPVFANTDAVTSPLPGAMVYSTADATVMVYSGDTWDSFCTQQLALTTGAFAQFTVQGGIPYLPVLSTTAVTSTTGTAGTLYYPSNQTGVRINNSVNWFTPTTLAAAPVTTTYTTAGNLTGLAGGVAIPVKAANPTFVASDKGAIYINSADFKLHVNNGTAWVAIDCSACPAYASGVTLNVDDPANINTIVGGYSYFQKTGIAESTSLYRWRIATDAAGAGATLDPTTTITYTPGYSDALDGKYLQFEVRPRATGSYLGTAATSPWTLFSNCPPQAAAALLTPVDTTYSAATSLPVSYSYYDKEGNLEGASVLTYYKADNAAGTTNKTQLGTGTTAYAYTYADADQGKYLLADVLPKAASGYSTGTVISSPTVKIWNCPPQANGVLVGVADETFSTATQNIGVSYSYFDKEANAEGTSDVKLYLATSAAGAGAVQLASGAGLSYAYTYTDADEGKYLYATVTPIAAAGYSTGSLANGATLVHNCPPQATGVLVNGTLTVGQVLTAGYAYYDSEGDAEETSTYQWYRATDAAGTGKTAISGATSATYTLEAGDSGKFIGLGVTPKATKGYSTGTELITYTTTAANP